MGDNFQIGDLTLKPGQRGVTRLPVTRLLVGTELALPVVVVHGEKPGPVLGITCAIHGGEHFPIQIVRRVLQELDTALLRGTVAAVPVANPVTFASRSRIVLEDDIDFGNMNRVFPGVRAKPAFGSGESHPSDRTVSEMMAAALNDQFLSRVTHYVDFHCHMESVGLVKTIRGDNLEGTVREVSYGMNRAMDLELTHEHHFSANTASGTAVQRGIPTCVAEIGGGGALALATEKKAVERGVRGVRNVMTYLGMLPGKPEPAHRLLLFHQAPHVRPTVGGYLLTRYDPTSLFSGDRLGVEVRKGELLGTVFDPYTFEPLEDITSPADGILYMARRSGPVDPGAHAYAVGSLQGAEWQEGG